MGQFCGHSETRYKSPFLWGLYSKLGFFYKTASGPFWLPTSMK